MKATHKGAHTASRARKSPKPATRPPGRVMHLLKRFGQRVTVCPMWPKKRAPQVTNEPQKVTCKRCLQLFQAGKV